VDDEQPNAAQTLDQRRGVMVGILISVLIALGVFFYWRLAR